MSFHMRPSRTKAGGTLHATARGFLPNEYVTIWDYTGNHWHGHAAELPGGNATVHGTLSFDRETVPNITNVGMRKICLQGERSHRVACATYRVLSAGPAVGPGYVPPGSGSSSSSGSSGSSVGSGTSSSGSGWTPPTTGAGYVAPGGS
jgi:hypothetical protein